MKKRPEMAVTDGVNCALEVLGSEAQEFPQQGRWVVEDQCPLLHWDISRTIDKSLPHESLSHFTRSTVSTISQDCREVN